MSRRVLRRLALVTPLALAALNACTNTEPTAPTLKSNPMFAQGDNGVWTVNSPVDPGDGVCDDADCTLREAIASTSAGDQIVFASGLQGTILLSYELAIFSSVGIDGGGRITLDGHASSGRLMGINGSLLSQTVVTLDGLTFTLGTSGSDGGALWVGQNVALTIRNSVISNNTAASVGGGISISPQSTVTLINSTIDGNSAGGNGGGIHNVGTLIISGSTLSGNQGDNGGAIFNASGGSATIARSTISANDLNTLAAGPLAGGIMNQGHLNMQSTTITKNALYGFAQSAGQSATGNSIIVRNSDPFECRIDDGSAISLGHNLTNSNAICNFNAASDVTILYAQSFTHVLEPDLKDNGGPAKTHALIARGFAVDAGHCPGENADQRGFARPVDDPTMPNALDGCDVGAYEAQGPQVAVADLMVSQAVDKNSVKQGELLTYTVRVQNLGPQTAPNVILSNVLSSGVTFVEVRQNKGTVTAPPAGETGTVTWNLGDMANQANEFAEIVVTVLVKGRTTVTNTATVSGNVADPNTANNTAAITVSVAAGTSKSGGKKG